MPRAAHRDSDVLLPRSKLHDLRVRRGKADACDQHGS